MTILQLQSEFLEQDIPCQADIGLLRIDNNDLKAALVPSPMDIIKNLKEVLPVLLKSRTLELKQWFNTQSVALKSNNSSIDEFVRQQNSLKYAEKHF